MMVSLRQNGVAPEKTCADAILPKGHIRRIMQAINDLPKFKCRYAAAAVMKAYKTRSRSRKGRGAPKTMDAVVMDRG